MAGGGLDALLTATNFAAVKHNCPMFQRQDLKTRMAEGRLDALLTATNFAAVKHNGQKRKDPEGSPYINHPIGVAHILSQV